MKQVIFISAILLSIFSCSTEKPTHQVADMIQQLKSEYAPDKRVAILNLEYDDRKEPVVITGETQFPEVKEELQVFFDTAGIAYVDSIRLLPGAELGGSHFGIVRLPVANMRSQPKHSAELSSQATLGTPLKIWKQEGNWYYVQTPDQYLGWLDEDGFTSMKIEQFRAWQQQEKVMVKARNAFVFESEDTGSPIVSNVVVGNILSETKTGNENFRFVKLPDGRQGYLPGEAAIPFDIWLQSRNFEGGAVIETAKDFMGVPYLWGGTSSNGFDCSGYTKTVYYLNGLVLPRDASQQVHVGEELGTDLDFDLWKAGDLLFFGRKATTDLPEKITHVAIYLGNGKMIHSAGNVKIESLKRTDPDFAAHRYDSFVRAKRIVGVSGDFGVYALSSLAEYVSE